MNKTQFNCRIDDAIKRQFLKRANQLRMPPGELLADIISQWLADDSTAINTDDSAINARLADLEQRVAQLESDRNLAPSRSPSTAPNPANYQVDRHYSQDELEGMGAHALASLATKLGIRQRDENGRSRRKAEFIRLILESQG